MTQHGSVLGARDGSCRRRCLGLLHRRLDLANGLTYGASSLDRTRREDRLVSRSIRTAGRAPWLVLLVAAAIVWIPSHAAATVPALNGVIAGIAPRTYDLTLLNLRDGTRTILLKFGYEESG